MGRVHVRELIVAERDHVQSYILQNCQKLDQFVDQFNELPKHDFPHLDDSGVDQFRLANFSSYFKNMAIYLVFSSVLKCAL